MGREVRAGEAVPRGASGGVHAAAVTPPPRRFVPRADFVAASSDAPYVSPESFRRDQEAHVDGEPRT